MLIVCWIWLQIRYGLVNWPFSKKQALNEVNEHLKQTLKRQYNELGKLQYVDQILNKELKILFPYFQME